MYAVENRILESVDENAFVICTYEAVITLQESLRQWL